MSPTHYTARGIYVLPSEEGASGKPFFFWSIREDLGARGWEKKARFPKKGEEEKECGIGTPVSLKKVWIAENGQPCLSQLSEGRRHQLTALALGGTQL